MQVNSIAARTNGTAVTMEWVALPEPREGWVYDIHWIGCRANDFQGNFDRMEFWVAEGLVDLALIDPAGISALRQFVANDVLSGTPAPGVRLPAAWDFFEGSAGSSATIAGERHVYPPFETAYAQTFGIRSFDASVIEWRISVGYEIRQINLRRWTDLRHRSQVSFEGLGQVLAV